MPKPLSYPAILWGGGGAIKWKNSAETECLKPPSILNLQTQNLAQAWKTCKEECNLYVGMRLAEKQEAVKMKLVLQLIGQSEKRNK